MGSSRTFQEGAERGYKGTVKVEKTGSPLAAHTCYRGRDEFSEQVEEEMRKGVF